MNYKLEKFWNEGAINKYYDITKWTINLKSFEIAMAGMKTNEVLDEL